MAAAMEIPSLGEQQQLQMSGDALDAEAQSARSEKPHLSSSCDAVVAAACTSSDDAACLTTSDLEDAAPFCIRGYVAAVRDINISKCWPFSRQLLEESIREGKHPLLPPLSPNACVVEVIPEYYHHGTAGSVHDVDEACGANDGPQLQVQIDLNKFEAELDSHGCAGTNIPANPLNPSLEAAPLQEVQAPCVSLKAEPSKHGNPFGDCSLVFKRQAPRSIREIRKSIMQGCQCFNRMDVAYPCRKDSCSKSSTLRTPAADVQLFCLNAFDGHAHDGLQGPDKKGFGDHENVSGITQLEPCREKPADESQGAPCSHAGSSAHIVYKIPGEMGKGVNQTNKQSVILAASVPLTSQLDVNIALDKDIPAHSRTEYTNRRCSVSDSQSVDKSHESHNLKSSNSRECWDTATHQDSLDTIACLDNGPQQRCPVCLLFQSSSNTALNVHIDRCLAALSMEEGTTKSKIQKVKVRKKRSMAELCLVAPSSVVGGENTNESTLSDCNIKSQMALKKVAAESKDRTNQKENELCRKKSKVNTFKLLQWGSRSSSRHGVSRRGPIHEARIASMKNQSFQGRALEWRTTSVLRNTRNWKRQKTNHESVAELPQNNQHAPEEKAKKLRKLIQRNKRVQNQNPGKDFNKKGAQSIIEEASNELQRKVLPKHKTAALRAVLPREKKSSKDSKKTAHVLTSDTLMTVIGSHETTVEFLHTDSRVNAEQSDKNKEKVKFRVHIQPTKKHKNKCNKRTRADLQEASDLRLAIIRIPSISQKDCNAECQSVRSDNPLKQNPLQAHSGIAEGFLETQVLSQPSLSRKGNCIAGNSRRIAEEWSVQDPSLPLLSAMMEDHQNERRKPSNCRKMQISSTHTSAPPCLTCNVLQSSKSGGLTCFRDTNDMDVSLLPIGAQPQRKVSLRDNSDAYAPEAWHSRQKEIEQIQVKDSQQEQVSHFLSTTSPNNNSVPMQQFSRFPFSLPTTETPWWPGPLEERNFQTAGSEGLPSHFIQSLEVAKRTLGASLTSQDFGARQESLRHDTRMMDTGGHFSVLQKNAEVHQYNPGSNQSILHKDVCSAQIPSFPGSSRDNTWQAQNHSQRLPPWMEAAIQDQRSPVFSSTMNSGCQSRLSNTTPNISTEMSRTLSMFEMIGNPVLRLMGKTMVLMPEASQGHVDLNTGQLSSQSTYINFFQSLEPEEATYEAQKQSDQSQVQNLHIQSGIQPEYLSSDEFNCRNNVQSWITSKARSIPQLQDFFLRKPSSSQIPSANQPTNSQNKIAEQNHPFLRGGSQLLSSMSHRAQLNWQHQKAQSPSPFWPQSSSCCPRNQTRPNLDFYEGSGQCNSFRSNITLPQAPRNSTYNVNNVQTRHSNFPSWLSSTVNRTNTAHQPANVIILDDEGPLSSFDTSSSMPLGRGMVTHSKLPAVSAAQQTNISAECRAKLADSCRPPREKTKDPTFIPIIYTVGGNFVESQLFPGSVGPKVQKSATTAHERRGVQNYGTVVNPRKRVSCFAQPGDSAKHLKTSESLLHVSNVSITDQRKACSLGPSETGNCIANQTPFMNGLLAASERMQSTTHRGPISVPERNIGRDLASLSPRQDVVQGQLASNVSKESRLHAPTVGMCSTNMNPAEVDCQDAGQFNLTPSLEIISETSPVHNAQACMDMNVSMCPHPGAPTQEPRCSKWPLSSSSVNTPNAGLPHTGFESSVGLPSSTSLSSQNLLLQSSNKMAVNKEKSSLPIIYDSSKLPSFCETVPMVNRPSSSLPEGTTQGFFSPASQPGVTASAPGQDMHLFKAARKFFIMNGRVSIMDAQKNKGSVQANAMDVQTRFMHTNVINVQTDEEPMHSNQTDKEGRNANGRNQHVPDDMRQPAEVSGNGRASASASASARDRNDKHEAVATTELTELRAPPGDRVCESL